MRLYYETHSTSTDNERGVASGHSDPDLSNAGVGQAKELGQRYRGIDLACIFCSDLLRARRTAEIAFEGRGVPVILDARLRECDFGDLNGAPVAIVEVGRPDHVREPYPGGESYAQVVDRVAAFLGDVVASGDGPVLVIGHRATHHALEHILNGAALDEVVTGPWGWRPGWKYELC